LTSHKAIWGLLVGLTLGAGLVSAQEYPNKPIRIIVGFPPGGGADTVARLIVPKLSEHLGQQLVIDNRSGASGNIALEQLAKALPDGYTLMVTTPTVTVNPALYARPGYDSVNDFTPIALMVSTVYVLVVHPSLPVKSVKELVALAKAKPHQLNYSSGGNGSAAHLSLELFRSMTGIDVVHVPYKGIAPGLIAVLSGEVQFTSGSPTSTLPLVKEGKLRALAVTSAKRSAFIPELPSISEAGVPGYETTAWYGMLAPAKLPKLLVDKLNAAIINVIALPDVRDSFLKQSFDITTSTPDEFSSLIKSELSKWRKIVKESGMRIE
jgi:tripartite-type tricarboxylate transporter receptor subunit TctC